MVQIPTFTIMRPFNTTLYDFEAYDIGGQEIDLIAFRDKVVLIVNTASQCIFTPQFTGLETLHRTYVASGLVVMGFPCNQFGAQDPAPNAEIVEFCKINYSVSFLMMSKVEVNGPHAYPLYKWLTSEAPGLLGSEAIKWNFTKFLVGREGQVIKRYGPMAKATDLARDIEAALTRVIA